MSTFASIPDILPEGVKGSAKIEHFTVKKDFWAMREGVTPGKYARLYVDGQLLMSDTDNERSTNWRVAYKSNGRVLIAGLGIGMILTAILDKPEVESVIVIEKYQDVIDLVAPHYRHPKLTVICGDIFEWKPAKGEKFDTIYFDIWGDISTDVLGEMATLHRRFGRYLNRENPEAWMDSWQKGFLKLQLQRDRRRGW